VKEIVSASSQDKLTKEYTMTDYESYLQGILTAGEFELTHTLPPLPPTE
jgi:hypothetical protein